jgi:hypothetical protein
VAAQLAQAKLVAHVPAICTIHRTHKQISAQLTLQPNIDANEFGCGTAEWRCDLPAPDAQTSKTPSRGERCTVKQITNAMGLDTLQTWVGGSLRLCSFAPHSWHSPLRKLCDLPARHAAANSRVHDESGTALRSQALRSESDKLKWQTQASTDGIPKGEDEGYVAADDHNKDGSANLGLRC